MAGLTLASPSAERRPAWSPWRETWRRYRRHKLAVNPHEAGKDAEKDAAAAKASCDLDVELIGPSEIQDRFPLVDLKDVAVSPAAE